MEDFRFTYETMEKFIHDLLLNNDFADGTLVIKVSKDIKKMALAAHGNSFESATDECISLLMEPENIYSLGFKFFIENHVDLQLNPVGIQEVLQVIAVAGLKSLTPDVDMPEEGIENYDSLKAAAE